MKEFEGTLSTGGKRFAIVASRFNNAVVEKLVAGACAQLKKLGVDTNGVAVFHVPGAFEIPPVARRIAECGRYHAVICLGAVIRGDTPHFDYVAGESPKGIARLALEASVPVIYGVLTTATVEQALDRAGAKAGNKGADAAAVGVEMANLYELIDKHGPIDKQEGS